MHGGREAIALKVSREETKREETIEEQPALPDWIHAESWTDFVAFRKKIKKPLTPRAAANALKKLGEWRDDGYDPNEIIDQCVLNGWQGLYLPRDMQKSGKSQDNLPPGWVHADDPPQRKWGNRQ